MIPTTMQKSKQIQERESTAAHTTAAHTTAKQEFTMPMKHQGTIFQHSERQGTASRETRAAKRTRVCSKARLRSESCEVARATRNTMTGRIFLPPAPNI